MQDKWCSLHPRVTKPSKSTKHLAHWTVLYHLKQHFQARGWSSTNSALIETGQKLLWRNRLGKAKKLFHNLTEWSIGDIKKVWPRFASKFSGNSEEIWNFFPSLIFFFFCIRLQVLHLCVEFFTDPAVSSNLPSTETAVELTADYWQNCVWNSRSLSAQAIPKVSSLSSEIGLPFE